MALTGSEFLTLDLVDDARKYEEQRMHLLQQHR
jgi:hypothetical protein